MNLAHLVKQYFAVPIFLLTICLYISYYNSEFNFDNFLTSTIIALTLYLPLKVLKLLFHKEYGRYPNAHIAHDRILILLIILWIGGIVSSYFYLGSLDTALGAGIMSGLIFGFTFEGVTGKSIFK